MAVLAIVMPLAKEPLFWMIPLNATLALPLICTVMLFSAAEPNLNPSNINVLPAPDPVLLAVKVAPVELPAVFARVLFKVPIFKVVPLPAMLMVSPLLWVTNPAPKSRLFAEVLLVVPKVVVAPNVIALVPALMTADPLVLLIVAPADMLVRDPVPSALALLMFRTAPLLTEMLDDAPELFPLKVNVPEVTVINPA